VIISTPKHEISIVVGGKQIGDWESYSISTSMTTPVDEFRLRRVFDRDVWNLCKPDTKVQVCIDGVAIVTGLIDDAIIPEGEYALEIVGRCMIGRLVDDCAETVNFAGLTMLKLIEKLVPPFFTKVTASAVRDRNLRRGKGKKARGTTEALQIATRAGTQIEPGQTRWQVIDDLCEQAGVLARSSGDGKELIVAAPNYAQEIQFRFFRPLPHSKRANESTVLSMGVKLSVGERYSRVLVVGSGKGTAVNYGDAVSSRFGEAKNNPATRDGEGRDFTLPKRLQIQRALQSTDEANELAEREMAKADAQGDVITVTCPAHGQRIAGVFTTLFACDLLASVEDEWTGLRATYLITSCAFEASRQAGQTTKMVLVRKGAVLA
jgi:prophage tail gpP-like protein